MNVFLFTLTAMVIFMTVIGIAIRFNQMDKLYSLASGTAVVITVITFVYML